MYWKVRLAGSLGLEPIKVIMIKYWGMREEIKRLEEVVDSLPLGSEERLEASINLAELSEIFEDDYFGY